MGDVAEMILDGVLCECCGMFIGEGVGHPRDCKDCRRAQGEIVPDDDFEIEDEKENYDGTYE